MSIATKTPVKPKSSTAMDAIALLRADHIVVRDLFADYQEATSTKEKKALAAKICTALTVHAQIEEEIFYPAVKAALKDKVLVPEARVEHAGIKELIAEIEGAAADGEMYDAKVQVLSEYVKHHVKEEQEEMFPKVKASSLDLVELGVRMAARRVVLLAARG